MKCSNNIANGNGVEDIFAFDGYALRISTAPARDIQRQGILFTKKVGIVGTLGFLVVNGGGIAPVVAPSHTYSGSMPLSIAPQYREVPSWATPKSKF